VRIGQPGASAVPTPNPEPQAAPTPAPSASAAARVTMRSDGVDRSTSRDASPLTSVGEWSKDEWPTVATAVHGLASAPGIVADAYRDAAKTNSVLASKIGNVVSEWESRAPAARTAAIDDLKSFAKNTSRTASTIANDLERANTGGTDAAVKSARDAATSFASAAAAQTARASGTIARISGRIGTTVGAALGKPGTAAAVAKAVGAVPGLKETPVLGLAIAGIGTATDVASKKAGVADAVVANAGATLAGTVVGAAVTPALTSALAGSAGADVATEALGVAVAAGPVGWAVAGGVIVGAAAGYGVYRAIESAPGQQVVDGITHFDGHEIARGFAEAGDDIASFGAHLVGHAEHP
jgi:hypothetical protein